MGGGDANTPRENSEYREKEREGKTDKREPGHRRMNGKIRKMGE